MQDYPQQPPLSERIEASMEQIAKVDGFTTFGQCYGYIDENKQVEGGFVRFDPTSLHLAIARAKILVSELGPPNGTEFGKWLGLSFLYKDTKTRHDFQNEGVNAWARDVSLALLDEWGRALDRLLKDENGLPLDLTPSALDLRTLMVQEGNAIINSITVVRFPTY